MASAADNRRGIFSMLFSVVTFVASDLMVRLAAETLPTGEIMAFRGVLATSIVFATATFSGFFHDLPRFLKGRVLFRGALEGLIAILFIAALPHLPFAVITATLLASSLVTTALAALLGIERVGIRRWSALAVGFVGVLVVLRPTPSEITPAALLALGCTFLVGFRDIVTRTIDPDTPTIVIALASTLLVTLLGAALGLVETGWRWPTLWEATLLAGAAAAVACGNIMIVAAFRRADVAVVTPFRYTSIVFASLAGIVVWRETPDIWTLIGSLMIVGSGLYTIWRVRVRAREAKKAEDAS